MSDGSSRVSREETRVALERVIGQRDEARRRCDLLQGVIDKLVRVHDGPNSIYYAGALRRAWQAARDVMSRPNE